MYLNYTSKKVLKMEYPKSHGNSIHFRVSVSKIKTQYILREKYKKIKKYKKIR